MTAHKKSFDNGVQIGWDATSIELAQTCLRKYYYTMILGIRESKKSVHLLFGGIYASALENFYKYRAEGMDIQEALEEVVHEAMIASWEYKMNPDGTHQLTEDGKRIGGPKHFDDVKKTRNNLIRTIIWYVEQFGVENEDGLVTYHLQNGKPAVELSFTLEVDTDLLLCGHLDRVVSMGPHLYVMDQKTTGGTVGPYYFNQFSPNNQMSLYSWAGRAILSSPIHGVIIDAAQIALNFTRFERGVTPRSKDQLTEWFASAKYTIKNAQYASDRWNHLSEEQKTPENLAAIWPMTLASCGNYGGCPFRLLCSRSPGVRENFIRADYTEHNWDPLEAR